VGEHVSNDSPGPVNKLAEAGRYTELVVNGTEKSLKSRDGRNNHQYAQYREHRDIDDNKLHMCVVIPLKCVLKFL
jgi:hypothetical protein